MRMLCCLLLISLRLLPAVDVDRMFDTASVSALLEWQLSGSPDEWLTTDSQHLPRVVVMHEHGARWNVSCFATYDYRWDGDDPLTVGGPWLAWRFCPPRTGLYRWSLLAPDSSQVVATGSFVATATLRRHGPLRVHPTNSRLLATTDGNAFISLGPNIGWAQGPDRLQQMRDYLDQLADAGGTHFRLWCASWMAGLADPETPGQLRFAQADLLDRILAYANELGLYVTLVLDNAYDVEHGQSGLPGATMQERFEAFFQTPLNPLYRQRLDYVLARYSAWHHILAWELFNEIDEVLRQDGYTVPHEERVVQAAVWLDAAAAHVRAHDSFGHLITASCARTEDRELLLPLALDLIQIHSYVPAMAEVESQHKDGIALLAQNLPLLLAGSRPYCFSEVGFHGTNERNDGHQLDPGGILLRQQAWAGLLLGGYGSGMNWWWDVYIDEQQLWSAYTPLALAVERVDWNDPKLRPIGLRSGPSVHLLGWQSPQQALLWPHLSRNSWRYQTESQEPLPYAGQLLRIGPLAADSSYNVHWLDLRDGSVRSQPEPLQTDAEGWSVLVLEHGHEEAILHLRLQAAAH